MRELLCFILIFIFAFNAYCEEGKQENIIGIEKKQEQATVIQSPQKLEKIELMEEEQQIKTVKPVLKKPSVKPSEAIAELKMSEKLHLKSAWKFYEVGNYTEALMNFQSLINSKDKEVSLSAKLGLAYSLKNLNKNKEAIEIFEELYELNYKKEEIIKILVELLFEKEEFERAENYALELKEPEKSSFIRKTKEAYLYKSFNEIAKSEAKSAYLEFIKNKEKLIFECISPEIFFEISEKLKSLSEKDAAKSTLEKILPCADKDLKLRIGILYAISDLVPIDEAIQYISREKITIKDDQYLKQLNSLEIDLLRKKLSLVDIYSPYTENIARRILELYPEDKYARATLAWHYYNKKEYEKALTLFEDLREQYPEEEDYILGIVYCYNALEKEDALIDFAEKIERPSEKLKEIIADAYITKANKNLTKGNYSQAFTTIDRLSKKAEEGYSQKSAQWYCREGFPILASHADSLNQKACYYKEQSPQIQIELTYRQKSGDEGLSKLKELRIPISFHYPIKTGQKLSFNIIQKHVDSGSLEANPYMGKYYLFLNGKNKENSPITSRWLLQPEILYEKEGYPHLLASLGTTPFNATVSPMPLFNFNIDYRYFWLNLHQEQIEESILSIQGQKDPYSNAEWGRVLKTGIKGGLNFNISDLYWFSLSGEYDYIWGKNIWQNYSTAGNMSIGRTFIMEDKSQLDIGLFYVIKHFKRNSNFFTFGHGGYFSPQIFHMFGPTLRYQRKDCCSNWLDIKASLGYIYYRTDRSPHYPKFDENITSYNSRAQDDINAYYSRERKSKIGGSIEAKISHAISKNLTLYGHGKGNISGGYNEWKVGVGLIYYFIQ